MYVVRNPNFICEYGQWTYFFRDSFRDKLKNNGIDSLTLNFNKITIDSLFRFSIDAAKEFKISIADIESHGINVVFYFRGSITYENDLNLEKYTNKK